MNQRRGLPRLPLGCLLSIVALGVLAANADAKVVYVANLESNDVSAINAATGQPLSAPIPVGLEPEGIAITPDGKTAYVANVGSKTVLAIDTEANKVVGPPIPVGNQPDAIAITPDGKFAYVTNDLSENVSVIDLGSSPPIVQTVKVGQLPVAVAITPDGKSAYVVNFSSDNVSVINTATNEVIDTVTVGERPIGVAISPDGKTAYVANHISENVSVIPVGAHEALPAIPVSTHPNEIAITPDGRTAYVSGESPSEVDVIDLGTNKEVASLPGAAPTGIAITPDGKSAFVAALLAPNSLAVIDTQTNKAVGSPIPVGELPVGVAIVPNQGPLAALSVPRLIRLGAVLRPNAAKSKDPDGTISTYSWDFNDGAKAQATGPNPSYAFIHPGKHRVTLTVTDTEGCSTVQVFTGKTAFCNGSVRAMATQVVKVMYPRVRVKCPTSARPRVCKFVLQAVTKKRKGKAETALTRITVRAGKAVSASLKPKPRFIKKLGRAKTALVKQTLIANGSRRATFRQLRLH